MDQYNFQKNKDFDSKDNTPKLNQNQINLGNMSNSPNFNNLSNQSQYNASIQNHEQRVDPFTFNQIEVFLQHQVNNIK